MVELVFLFCFVLLLPPPSPRAAIWTLVCWEGSVRMQVGRSFWAIGRKHAFVRRQVQKFSFFWNVCNVDQVPRSGGLRSEESWVAAEWFAVTEMAAAFVDSASDSSTWRAFLLLLLLFLVQTLVQFSSWHVRDRKSWPAVAFEADTAFFLSCISLCYSDVETPEILA